MRAVEVGEVIGEKYRIESKLGQGGMASVWLAHHLVLDAPVAIKLIDPAIALGELGIARFVREAKAAAALRSPHVVQIFDYGADAAGPYIVMEYMKGEPLSGRIAREGALTPAFTAHVLGHVARAVGRAHEMNIVHRDLKPDNIFLVDNDEEIVAKVLDFGIAKTTDPNLAGATTNTGAVMGSPFYMSPEQCLGSKTVDWRSDLWSMAVVAYECLLGQQPFQATALGELLVAICTGPIPVPSQVGTVPPGFDEWWAYATQRDPEARFQSAREQVAALRAICGVEATLATERRNATAPVQPVGVARSGLGMSTTTGPVSKSSSLTGTGVERRSNTALLIAGLGAVTLLGAGALGVGIWRAKYAEAPETPTAASLEDVTPEAPSAAPPEEPPAVSVSVAPAPSASVAPEPGPTETPAKPAPVAVRSKTPAASPKPKPAPEADPKPSATETKPNLLKKRF